MKWPRRALALLVSAVVLAGCATAPSSRESRGGAPRVRCLSDPSRDAASVSGRPLFFLFCVESP